jgi:acetolactate synthase-1/2/3 large subunit
VSDGVDILCTTLADLGVDRVFGVPGTQNVHLFEGFRRHHLRTVLASHELAASFMANGYYRATGRAAVLATIPGPGFTYALTGLAEARLDSAALVYLVGLPAKKPGRAFQLQAIDQATIAGPLVKGILEITTAADAARVIREAHALSLAGEPGPVMVHLDMHAIGLSPATAAGVASPADAGISRGVSDSLGELSALFGRAKRPVFYLGAGAFGCAEQLERLATSLRIPVLTTPTARGIVSEERLVAMGFDPLRGHIAEANSLLDRSDLILALGCKLGHNGSAGFQLRLERDKLVHVDASAEVAGANYDARLAIVARIEDSITPLEARTHATDWSSDELTAIRASLRAPMGDAREPVIAASKALSPAEFFAWLRKLLPSNVILVTDSGQHQILTRRHFEVRSARGLIVPSDLQSMGFGLPAAIGARLGVADRPVVAIIGDGGFLMSGLELLTAKREDAPLVVFVFNDGYLNQIRMQQWREFGHSHAVELVNPNFEVLAESFGIGYVRLDQAKPGQIEDALASKVTTLVEVLVADSMSILTMPLVARAKNVARAVVRPGLREWLKAGLRR